MLLYFYSKISFYSSREQITEIECVQNFVISNSCSLNMLFTSYTCFTIIHLKILESTSIVALCFKLAIDCLTGKTVLPNLRLS